MPVTYPRYLIWFSDDAQIYEITRWDDLKTVTVVQTNIRTFEKATQALADWKKRAAAKDQP